MHHSFSLDYTVQLGSPTIVQTTFGSNVVSISYEYMHVPYVEVKFYQPGQCVPYFGLRSRVPSARAIRISSA